MSLIPYNPPEGREIVLRHQNAIVVRDTSSQRLEIRSLSLTECPTCHQPLRPTRPDGRTTPPTHDPNYVDPNYFRMLRHRMRLDDEVGPASHTRSRTPRSRNLSHSQMPSSPILRLTRPVLPSAVSLSEDSEEERTTPVESDRELDGTRDNGRIRREAFMPNYFKTFFVEEGVLGKGGKGVVLLVRHEIDGCHLGHYACKRVPVGDNHEWLENVLVEVELLSKFSHPNLVQFRHVWLEDVRLGRFGPRVACAFILQKYCNGGDLLHYVIGDQFKETTKEELKARARRRSRGQNDVEGIAFRRLTFEEIYSLFKDITSGLAYLHAANYVHRDLKPGNCLLHSEGGVLTCLISDFGEVRPENVMRQSTGSTGTISYCAPEVLRRDIDGRYSNNFTTKSDMFSLGMVLYFLCFGRLPYHGANMAHEELEDVDALREEISGWEGFREERRSRPDLPLKLYQLLSKLLAPNPSERPGAAEVLTAMNSEGSLDGVPMSTRAGRAGSPVVELHGRRIQNLDSPIAPGTPEPLAMSARVPSKGFSASDSDGTTLHPPPSPHYAPGSPTRASLTPPSPSRSLDPAPTSPLPARFTAPLLLPPPTTRMGVVHYGIRLGLFHAYRTLSHHIRTVSLVTRLGIFLVKMVTIARPCWPYAAPVGIALPLVALAGVDLAMHGDDNWRRMRVKGWLASTVLVGAHFAILALAERSGGMCRNEWGPDHDL